MVIRIKLPSITTEKISNLVGLLGLIAIIVAVGGLTNWWYSLLVAGVFSVGIAYVINLEDDDNREEE